MLIYTRCDRCGLIHFSEENACPKCGSKESSSLIDREQVGFKEAIEYAYSIRPECLFCYPLCVSLVSDFAPHLKNDWKILLRTAFDCGAIEELRTESAFIRNPYERAKQKLSRFLRDNDRDLVLFAYMGCLYPESDLPHTKEESGIFEEKQDVFQSLVNCLARIVELKQLESSGALEGQIASLEHQLKMLKRYSNSAHSLRP